MLLPCSSNVKLDGVMTHFASADMPDKGRFTWEQIARLEATVEMVRLRGHKPTWIHQANSAAATPFPKPAAIWFASAERYTVCGRIQPTRPLLRSTGDQFSLSARGSHSSRPFAQEQRWDMETRL